MYGKDGFSHLFTVRMFTPSAAEMSCWLSPAISLRALNSPWVLSIFEPSIEKAAAMRRGHVHDS